MGYLIHIEDGEGREVRTVPAKAPTDDPQWRAKEIAVEYRKHIGCDDGPRVTGRLEVSFDGERLCGMNLRGVLR